MDTRLRCACGKVILNPESRALRAAGYIMAREKQRWPENLQDLEHWSAYKCNHDNWHVGHTPRKLLKQAIKVCETPNA